MKLLQGIYQARFKVQEDMTLEKDILARAEVTLKALTSSDVPEHYNTFRYMMQSAACFEQED